MAEQREYDVVVVGGEMAQAYRWPGAEEVTIVEQADRLLPVEEPFAGAELGQAFTDLGIRVRTAATAVRAARPAGDGPVTLTLEDGTELRGDELLVAVGRRPKTGDIGLETVGLTPGDYLDTDDRLRVRGVEATGSTPRVTSPAGRCSPNRASTRPGCRRHHRRLRRRGVGRPSGGAAGELHRPAGRRGRAYRAAGPRRRD